jgi:diadenosine tetraphosphate (Ap4A) HIT family hydrolase
MPASSQSDTSQCPFCFGNGVFKGETLGERPNAKAVNTHTNAILIVPTEHTEAVENLSDGFWHDLSELVGELRQSKDIQDYNLSLNVGKNAGQTVKHLHFWVIPREGGQPASGKGLALLIDERNAAEKPATE